MAEKTSYFVASVLLLVFFLLPHSKFCHREEEDSRCGCPETDLTKNSVNERSGAGILFTMRSYGGCATRRTLISEKSMNNLVVAAATVALYGSTVAVFAYLCLKSPNSSWPQMSLLASTLDPFSSDNFDENDHILSRSRIRAPPEPAAQGPLGRLWSSGQYT